VKLLVEFFLEKRTPSGWRFSQLLKDIHYPNSGSCYVFSNRKALTIGPSWGSLKCIENPSPKRQEDSTIYNHALILHRNTINARILTKDREFAWISFTEVITLLLLGLVYLFQFH
jgi:hypothetical protein